MLRNTISIFSLFIAFVLFNNLVSAQIIQDIPLKENSLVFYGSAYITANGEFVFADGEYDYYFDESGKLLRATEVGYKKSESNSTIHSMRLNDFYSEDKVLEGTDLTYNITIGNSAYKKASESSFNSLKYDEKLGIVRESVVFPDDLRPTRNLASPIQNDYSAASDYSYLDKEGNLVGLSLFMATSESTHSSEQAKKNVFHTFVHCVKYNLKTKQETISNYMVDKIDFPNDKGNFAYGSILGILGGKVIIEYTTFNTKDEEAESGATKDKKLSYWSLNLATGEETKLHEYRTSFNDEVVDLEINHESTSGLIVIDISWTEKSPKGAGYISNHKLLVFDDQLNISEEEFLIPGNILTLQNSDPAPLQVMVSEKNGLQLANLISEETGPNVEDPKRLWLYVYSKNDLKEVELTKRQIGGVVNSVDGYNVFAAKDFTDEEFAQCFGRIRPLEEIKTSAGYRMITAARIIDNELVTFSVEIIQSYERKVTYTPKMRINRVKL
jgi:hypothetical protein